jgi:hypothetical protein
MEFPIQLNQPAFFATLKIHKHRLIPMHGKYKLKYDKKNPIENMAYLYRQKKYSTTTLLSLYQNPANFLVHPCLFIVALVCLCTRIWLENPPTSQLKHQSDNHSELKQNDDSHISSVFTSPRKQ